ncbi:uncharacterized protein LOC143785109 isoform X2 [Ranitomeya variabilis]|uniref:uncharacterized protein LOC143785109 isoform X2 n=1 Tax=Ranitomeya variabilis TaxID=490064 RepID=UPI0040564611
MENLQMSVDEMLKYIHDFSLDGGVHGSFLPLDEMVEKLSEYEDLVEKVEETDLAPNSTDLIVPVMVHCGGALIEKDATEMSSFLQGCRTMTGLSPIIIITRKNNPYAEEIERRFRLAGAEQVVLVENYTKEDHLRTLSKDTAILTFLYHALQDVTFRMSERRHVVRERAERKKFLIKYMHHMVLDREIQKLRATHRTNR